MNNILTLSIDVTKIDKNYIKTITRRDGSVAKFLDISVLPNREGVNEYGHCAMVVQGVSKEAREQGIKGPILGNAKEIERRQDAPAPAPQRRVQDPAFMRDEDPFSF